VEHKTLAFAFEHRHAHQIAGHQVRGELHPREIQAEAARQRLGQRGFAHAGHVFDQQVAAQAASRQVTQ
jgi:hypothetical protein